MVCHDCGAIEGELHEIGCDMEECPICGRQAISCYEHCFTRKFDKKGNLIPKKSFVEGKRIPYIYTSNFCRVCLKSHPEMFMVKDEEWKKLPISLQKEMLCKNCYNEIKGWDVYGTK